VKLDKLRIDPVNAANELDLEPSAARVDDAPPKDELREATAKLLERLEELQGAFYADGRRALLLVLQGRDTAGKDGLIRKVIGACNPMGVRITSFGVPSEEEQSHDFLWRVHRAVPPRRLIGVFNRSHYEDVLVVRVRKLAAESVWSPRFAQINAFEEILARNDVVIRKCFLHVSHEEQESRLRARLDDPRKNWKFRLGDLDDRALWDEYTEAYRDVLRKCSTAHAPWYVVPSDRKPVRDYVVAKMLVETLEALGPEYPAMDPAVREAAGRQ
jgi:PPK2 family polyphosphate:nucleotide phosphotransferase